MAFASSTSAAAIGALLFAGAASAQYSATWLPGTVPNQTETGQAGFNRCQQWGVSSQDSLCQDVYLNSIDDFCLWGPPYSNGVNATISETERVEVSYCTKPGYGTRLIPDGTLTAVHFVKTSNYVQLTGHGNFSNIGIPANDSGGELDPHGYDGLGNPIGGLVFSNVQNGTLAQIHEWSAYISATEFCFKACYDDMGNPNNGTGPYNQCPHIYDEMGCEWVMPGNYANNVFETCDGETALLAGVVGTSTFTEGDAVTPPAKPIPSSSNCVSASSIPLNNAPPFTPLGAVAAAPTGSGGHDAIGTGTATAGSSGATGAASAAAPGAELNHLLTLAVAVVGAFAGFAAVM